MIAGNRFGKRNIQQADEDLGLFMTSNTPLTALTTTLVQTWKGTHTKYLFTYILQHLIGNPSFV